jgi:MFS family permease
MFKDKKSTWVFFLFIALFTLHITPAIYINTNFLNQFFEIQYIGLFYSIANITTIIAILGLRDKLRKFGNYKIFTSALIFEMFVLGLLLFSNSGFFIALSLIALFMTYSISFICLDVFLEKETLNERTGHIRGYFLTALNSSFIIGPFIASILLSNNDFKNVYIFMFILLFPIIFLTQELFKNFKDEPYDQLKIISGFKKIAKNTDLYSTVMSSFILNFFYSWMIIYIPLHLFDIGFSLSEVTLIISISLIPFVLIQSIAGKLADAKYGEKEMLIFGFIVLSIFTAFISFIDTNNISIWIAVLFMTRVGASMVEIMTETHLFKRIGSGDINTISIFRILRPAAMVIGSLVATFFLFAISLQMLFLVLSGVTFYGLRYALTITDTR